jgi:hypothetical protein
MARPSPRDLSTNFRLSPGRSGDIEDDDIRKVFAMFVFSPEDNEFVALIQSSSVSYKEY